MFRKILKWTGVLGLFLPQLALAAGESEFCNRKYDSIAETAFEYEFQPGYDYVISCDLDTVYDDYYPYDFNFDYSKVYIDSNYEYLDVVWVDDARVFRRHYRNHIYIFQPSYRVHINYFNAHLFVGTRHDYYWRPYYRLHHHPRTARYNTLPYRA